MGISEYENIEIFNKTQSFITNNNDYQLLLEFPQKINQSGNNDNWKVS